MLANISAKLTQWGILFLRQVGLVKLNCLNVTRFKPGTSLGKLGQNITHCISCDPPGFSNDSNMDISESGLGTVEVGASANR
jgi:hypothetical protein